MAQTAATIDEISGGRLNLGLGVSHRPVVEGWYGQTIDKPVSRDARVRRRSSARSSRGEDPPPGEKWQTGFRLSASSRGPDLPIYVAGAVARGCCALAGEIADGVILWLCNPNYIRDVVVPEVTTGREQAGKTLEGFDIVAAVPSRAAPTTSRPPTPRCARTCSRTSALPFYRAMIERSGFAADIERFDEAAGDRRRRRDAGGDLRRASSSVLTAVGDEDAVRAGVERYRDAGRDLAVRRPDRRRRTSRRRCAPPLRRSLSRPLQPVAELSATMRHVAVLLDELDRVLGRASGSRRSVRDDARSRCRRRPSRS